jgi:hypothetical protein
VHRAWILALTAVTLSVAAASADLAGARPRLAGPDPKAMGLTRLDVGHVAYVDREGATTAGPIAASRGYRRVYAGLTPASVQLLTVDNTVLIGTNPGAAASWVSSVAAATGSKAGLERLYAQVAKPFAAMGNEPVEKSTVLRAGALKAGDGAVEVVFRFLTADGAFQVGEIFVRVGGNLSAIWFSGAMPGLSASVTRQLARSAATRLLEGGKTT